MRQITTIQYLRALAAMSVAVYHAAGALPGTQHWEPGRYGVDLFFVISGFVMVYSTTDATTPWQFLRRRLVRIAPLYFVLTTIAFLIAYNFPSLMHHTWVTVPDYIRSVLFIPYYGRTSPVLLQGWTLNYEMFFYLLFALGLALPRAIGLALCLSCLGVLALIGFIAPPAGPILSLMTNWHLLEFGLGMLIALLCAARPSIVDADRYVPRGSLPRLLGQASYSIYLSAGFALSIMVRLWTYVPPSSASYAAFVIIATIMSAVGGVITYRLIEKPLLNLFRPRHQFSTNEPILTLT